LTAQDKPHIPRVDINAVYEDGVLKPERALDLPEGARLRVTVRLGTAAPSQRTRIGRQVVALAAAVRSTLAAMSHQILARIDGLAAAKVPLFAASAAAVIAGAGYLLRYSEFCSLAFWATWTGYGEWRALADISLTCTDAT
jgi:predicted DNA-binding antitoxin AbrB/MazE fold protein